MVRGEVDTLLGRVGTALLKGGKGSKGGLSSLKASMARETAALTRTPQPPVRPRTGEPRPRPPSGPGAWGRDPDGDDHHPGSHPGAPLPYPQSRSGVTSAHQSRRGSLTGGMSPMVGDVSPAGSRKNSILGSLPSPGMPSFRQSPHQPPQAPHGSPSPAVLSRRSSLVGLPPGGGGVPSGPTLTRRMSVAPGRARRGSVTGRTVRDASDAAATAADAAAAAAALAAAIAAAEPPPPPPPLISHVEEENMRLLQEHCTTADGQSTALVDSLGELSTWANDATMAQAIPNSMLMRLTVLCSKILRAKEQHGAMFGALRDYVRNIRPPRLLRELDRLDQEAKAAYALAADATATAAAARAETEATTARAKAARELSVALKWAVLSSRAMLADGAAQAQARRLALTDALQKWKRRGAELQSKMSMLMAKQKKLEEKLAKTRGHQSGSETPRSGASFRSKGPDDYTGQSMRSISFSSAISGAAAAAAAAAGKPLSGAQTPTAVDAGPAQPTFEQLLRAAGGEHKLPEVAADASSNIFKGPQLEQRRPRQLHGGTGHHHGSDHGATAQAAKSAERALLATAHVAGEELPPVRTSVEEKSNIMMQVFGEIVLNNDAAREFAEMTDDELLSHLPPRDRYVPAVTVQTSYQLPRRLLPAGLSWGLPIKEVYARAEVLEYEMRFSAQLRQLQASFEARLKQMNEFYRTRSVIDAQIAATARQRTLDAVVPTERPCRRRELLTQFQLFQFMYPGSGAGSEAGAPAEADAFAATTALSKSLDLGGETPAGATNRRAPPSSAGWLTRGGDHTASPDAVETRDLLESRLPDDAFFDALRSLKEGPYVDPHGRFRTFSKQVYRADALPIIPAMHVGGARALSPEKMDTSQTGGRAETGGGSVESSPLGSRSRGPARRTVKGGSRAALSPHYKPSAQARAAWEAGPGALPQAPAAEGSGQNLGCGADGARGLLSDALGL